MFEMTVQEMIDKFRQDIASGWLRSDDVIGFEYWTYDDVRDFALDDDYYGEVTDQVAREVWAAVARKCGRYSFIDNDVVRDEISMEFDKRMEADNGVETL